MSISQFRLVIALTILTSSGALSYSVKADDHIVSTFAEFQAALTISQTNHEPDTINIAATIIDISIPLTYLIYDSENEPLTINGAGPGSTILEGGNRDLSLLNITYDTAVWPINDSNSKISVNGITFQNANHNGYYGALVIDVNLADIEVRDCAFNNNWTDSYGAGAYLYSKGTITLADSVLTGNVSESYCGGGAYVVAEDAFVDNNQFVNNSITFSGDGAGICIDSTTASLTGNMFMGNTLNNYEDSGGAGAYIETESTTVIEGNTFSSNTITEYGDGGAAFISSYSGDVTFSGNDVIDNSNSNGDYGGGVYIVASNLDMSNNLIQGNSTERVGGGMYIEINDTGLIYNNLIVGNNVTGPSGNGGGLFLYGYFFTSSTYILTNNTITGNNVYGSGGGLYFSANDDNHSLELRNNIIWGNSAAVFGKDMFINANGDDNDTNSTINIYNNDYPDLSSGGLYITGNSPAAFYGENIHSDPLFFDGAAGDYHLSSLSPCRDSGDNSYVAHIISDFEGDERIINTIVDIGADEYFSTVLTGDINGDDSIDLLDVIVSLKVVSGYDNLGDLRKEADVDNNKIDLSDTIFLLNWLVQGQ